MAEALVTVGVVGSIVQLSHFSKRLLFRLEEYHGKLGDVPKVFRHIQARLPLLVQTLDRIKKHIDAGRISEPTEKAALVLTVDACKDEVEYLLKELDSIVPVGESLGQKTKSVYKSLASESKIRNAEATIKDSIQTLTSYYVVAPPSSPKEQDSKVKRIQVSLAAPDPSSNQHRAQKSRLAHTGCWFLDGEQYKDWKTGGASFLWLHGTPGCGKSVLTSSIVEDMQNICDGDPGQAFAFFYFDFNDTEKQTAELMVRSILAQLARQCAEPSSALDDLFASCRADGTSFSVDKLLPLLKAMLREFPSTYIVLDALDECNDRHDVLDILNNLQISKLDTVHVLVTSRREPDIELSIRNFLADDHFVCLQSAVVNKDIRRYIQYKWSNDTRFNKWKDDTKLKDHIETSLMEKADGMFRWAYCQLDSLAKCLTRGMLKKALADLPKTLDATYERILLSIDEEYREYTLRVLRWLSFSTRLLTLDEVAEIVAIDGNKFDKDEVFEEPFDILRVCSSLVTFTDNSGHIRGSPRQKQVRLAHYSVKEYLVSERIKNSNAALYSLGDFKCNVFIARSCLAYIKRFQAVHPLAKSEAWDKYKLAEYAIRFWTVHSRAANASAADLFPLVNELFLKKDSKSRDWLNIYDYLYTRGSPRSLWVGLGVARAVGSPIHDICLAGLTELIQPLVDQTGADINAVRGHEATALHHMAALQDCEVVERLLEAGADVNAQNRRGLTALGLAASYGFDKVVEKFLEAGASADGGNSVARSALSEAATNGHEKVVELLLEAGADVDARGFYGSPLRRAVRWNHSKVVRQLIAAGVDVDAQDDIYGTALQQAIFYGHDKVIGLLIEAGADIDVRRYDRVAPFFMRRPTHR